MIISMNDSRMGWRFPNVGPTRRNTGAVLSGLQGLGIWDETTGGDTAAPATGFDLSSLPGLIQAGQSVITGYQLSQINLQRAQQGLPPISASQVIAPVQVQGSLSPQTKTLVAVIAGGALAVWILTSVLKNRKRA